MDWFKLTSLFGRSFTKRPYFRHPENEKWIFRATKMKTSLGKLVGHTNIHTYEKYEIIWGNYHLKLSITSAICLESHDPSYSIALFEKNFLIVLIYSNFFGLFVS